MSKIFFDTNILLDILLPARPNHSKAIQAYKNICDRYDILAASENILTTIEYLAAKNGTECSVISSFFEGMLQNFEIYNFTDILDDGIRMYSSACSENKKIDFEDTLQLLTAIKNNCDTFITQDKGIHRLKSSIEIVDLETFV